MSGRLIVEYREDGDVTRLERPVQHPNFDWVTATRSDLENVLEAAVAQLLDSAKPRPTPSLEGK